MIQWENLLNNQLQQRMADGSVYKYVLDNPFIINYYLSVAESQKTHLFLFLSIQIFLYITFTIYFLLFERC